MSDYKRLFVERLGAHCPFAVPTASEWVAVEREFQFVMPADFKQLVETVGDGSFRDCIRLLNPSHLTKIFDRVLVGSLLCPLGQYLHLWRPKLDFPLWPKPGGAFPVATGDSGSAVLYLASDRGADSWIYVDFGLSEWQAYQMPCWEFFFKLFEGQLDGFGRVFFTEREEEWESLRFFARFPWHQDS